MALLGVDPDRFMELGAYETDMLARELYEERKAEIEFRIALAKAGSRI